MFEVFISAIK